MAGREEGLGEDHGNGNGHGKRLGVLRVPGEVRAPGRVRRWVRGLLAQGGYADDGDSTEVVALLTSEVVTNAVQHGPRGGEIRVAVWRDGKRVRVECADSGGGVPVARDAADGDEDGRGLMLLDGLARDWGSRTGESGTSVWFEVDA
ncbi:anti-sigma regulatory factor (Ser/Thr protein kinase) [Actinocorallia herbida]|uniref:Anti-sigma regulatory factor (Ser/Thr protein kinase) n=1 Tax=Actinocorallia herbida TaxID=58109 RepID=A0A3N1DBT3_9ACTN|nr:ATP-binding protein [Actinocorallia herbida]ROO90981.1 anti-sigma regulatory factor (Ser/Thr protein kinase) [Actinocorallia herbida]